MNYEIQKIKIRKGKIEMVKVLSKYMLDVLIVLVVLFSVIALLSVYNSSGGGGKIRSIFGLKFMTVLSDSMSPALRAGDMIICRDKKIDDIKVGEIITYNINDFFVTHRVVEKIDDGGQILLKTRGDANNTKDAVAVGAGQLIGAFALRIPYGGYVINFFRSTAGLILILIVPASLFIYGEIKTLFAAKKDGQGRKGGSTIAEGQGRSIWLDWIKREVFNNFIRSRKNKEVLK